MIRQYPLDLAHLFYNRLALLLDAPTFEYNVCVSETPLQTKLYVPPLRPNLVPRSRLIERLNQGLQLGHKLTLISAPAGFGKTTLVSEWVAGCERPAAWLSLDEGDNDPTRFLAYLVAALQTIAANIGEGVLGVLQSPQPPPTEPILTTLLNEITTVPDNFVLVLDDYHVIDAKPVDHALTFLLEHLPPQMHLVIATREDPTLPLARLRVRDQLIELRVNDLRFTNSEAAGFLNQVMGLNLSAEDVAALETRTEGWIAGLQLAAISMRGHKDATSFIKSFTGSHHFVLDYLVEEVLQQQSESVQTFLLRTSILDRLCGPLCDAVLRRGAGLNLTPYASGQETLEFLEQANLFIVPLDNERHWYRYHHLFADLLRQRLQQQQPDSVAKLHVRASAWYEKNGLEIEAFTHAAAANDIERAERLIEGEGLPLHFRGGAAPVLNWLASQPATILDARPSLWVTYASALIFAGQSSSIEQKLGAAEAALEGAEPDDKTQDLVGHIAAMRAMMAVSQHQVETIIDQASRALELLHTENLYVRTAAAWTLGYAHELQGDRAAASRAYTDVISNSQASGNFMFTIAALTSLGNIQESENQLYQAAETHQQSLQLAGDPPLPFACASLLGLARVLYEWNDLDTAQQHGQLSAQLASQIEAVDTPAACGVLLARLKIAQGDVAGAVALLTEADQFVRQHNFVHMIPQVAATQVLTLLHQGDLAAAAQLAEKHDLPSSQSRVHLAQGDTAAALAVLEPLRRQVEAKGLEDERLKVMILKAVAHHAHGDKEEAVQLLGDALALAEPGGFIRLFVDEGLPMAELLSDAAARGILPDYCIKLLAVFEAEDQKREDKSNLPPAQPLIEPLSHRELEILQLIALGLSNREISERLFLALSTVKKHNGNIYGKLQVQRRTEAVARARELDLL
ncbi:MAG: LuxR C-terminal-related transcriptional regulator [Candidatus Promineifilaceae bacterium]